MSHQLESIKSGDVKFKTWAVGITTAPRKEPTISQCYASIVSAGWNDILVFAEPNCYAPGKVVRRYSNIGAWQNWFLGLSELVLRYPDADAYLMFEDDALLAKSIDIRSYLEECSWPDDVGLISLYCSSVYSKTEPGWYTTDRPWFWGALAIVLPRNIAIKALGAAQVATNHYKMQCGTDVILGYVIDGFGLKAYYCSPSLVSHIGSTSTIFNDDNSARGARKEKEFIDDCYYR